MLPMETTVLFRTWRPEQWRVQMVATGRRAMMWSEPPNAICYDQWSRTRLALRNLQEIAKKVSDTFFRVLFRIAFIA